VVKIWSEPRCAAVALPANGPMIAWIARFASSGSARNSTNPAVAVASLPGVLVAAFGSKVVVGVGPGMAVPVLEVGVPSHED
jgi:hypothetical protein